MMSTNQPDPYNQDIIYQDNVFLEEQPQVENSVVVSQPLSCSYDGAIHGNLSNESSEIYSSYNGDFSRIENSDQYVSQQQLAIFQESYNWNMASTTDGIDQQITTYVVDGNFDHLRNGQEAQSTVKNIDDSTINQQQQDQATSQQVFCSNSSAHSSKHILHSDLRETQSISIEWLDNICKQLIEHMNTYGICVIDNFLGSVCGEAIAKEVYQLYNNGLFQKGRLVNNKLVDGRVYQVRGDSMIWVDGSEEGCKQIEMLIQALDSVIINCNKMSGNNGEFDRHIINQRTKAMIACYPGNGTHYIKHIDNPNGDGRCITSIYYLNKDWDVSRDGGLLRIFPVGINEVANIAPLFDRVLFFWSDRRNPHEVQPAQRIRFAITVWFIDSKENQKLQHHSKKPLQCHQSQQQVLDENLLQD